MENLFDAKKFSGEDDEDESGDEEDEDNEYVPPGGTVTLHPQPSSSSSENEDESVKSRDDSSSSSSNDDDNNEEDEEDFNTNLERDLCELFCHKEKMFDVPKFESLLNGYAKMSSSIIGVERVIDAFKKTSKATRDDLKPSELVGWFIFYKDKLIPIISNLEIVFVFS